MAIGMAMAQDTPSQKLTAEKQLQQLTWLEGYWTRLDMKPGRTAHERWERTGEKSMRGWGVTLQEKDTVFVEKLQWVIKDDSLWYVADVTENKEPVWFKCTAVTPDGFTVENRAHDFPKMITYRKDGEKLLATISGNGRSMDFHFMRKTP